MKKSVTIGISAYNEEQNILQLLNSIEAQKKGDFQLDKVVIISDGSTDNTIAAVNNFKLTSKTTPIELISDVHRIGQPRRLVQLIAMSKSDYIIFFDADSVIADEFTINNLVESLSPKNIAISSARITSVHSSNCFEKLVINRLSVWEIICDNFFEGNNIYRAHGTGLAIKRELFSNLNIPESITSAAKYIYMHAISNNYAFKYVSESNIFYRVPNNFSDYSYQINRGGGERSVFEQNFGEIYKKHSHISAKIKLIGTLEAVQKHPLETFIGILFGILSAFFIDGRTFSKKGIWTISTSTKKAIIT